jgi:hypothetical protein
MKPQVFLSVFAIASLILACNLPTASGQAAPTQAVNETTKSPAGNTAIPPTNTLPAETPTITLTPPPTDTPTTAPTSTPSIPVLTPAKDPVNCRFGPGQEWQTVGALLVSEMATILGRTAGGNWWYIQLPANTTVSCWVAASVTVVSGNYAAVAVVAPPQAIVTKVSLTLKPTDITVPGCVFPYTPVDMAGVITTNGPTIVEWHWETSQGNISASDTLKFDQYDSKSLSDYVKYGAEGNYWVKLVVTKPNSMVAQAKYKVACGP